MNVKSNIIKNNMNIKFNYSQIFNFKIIYNFWIYLKIFRFYDEVMLLETPDVWNVLMLKFKDD